MTKTIGFRATPDRVYYAVIEFDADNMTILSVDTINVPKSLEEPEQLKTLRSIALDIINENNISKCCIKFIEGNAKLNTSMIPRIRIEGVLQELVASSTIQKYKNVKFSQIAGLLHCSSSSIAPFINDAISINECNLNSDFILEFNKVEEREAVITAIAAFYL
ncbi:hypothetical protein [Bacteroides sp.]|uniref:hypothetical protein n=1 Tax=Bacteroides sp. TaxID=29523 RepID=UPI00258260FB|nr:hypothetical protein [Bacteroides sp.]